MDREDESDRRSRSSASEEADGLQRLGTTDPPKAGRSRELCLASKDGTMADAVGSKSKRLRL